MRDILLKLNPTNLLSICNNDPLANKIVSSIEFQKELFNLHNFGEAALSLLHRVVSVTQFIELYEVEYEAKQKNHTNPPILNWTLTNPQMWIALRRLKAYIIDVGIENLQQMNISLEILYNRTNTNSVLGNDFDHLTTSHIKTEDGYFTEMYLYNGSVPENGEHYVKSEQVRKTSKRADADKIANGIMAWFASDHGDSKLVYNWETRPNDIIKNIYSLMNEALSHRRYIYIN